MVYDPWEWIAPTIIILFPSLYWILNHWFHLQHGTAYKKPRMVRASRTRVSGTSAVPSKPRPQKPKEQPGERPLDKYIWIGHLIWNILGIIPLYTFVENPWIVIGMSAIWPIIGSLVMGKIRGRSSVSTTLIFGTYGAIASTLWYIRGMKVIGDCINSISLIAQEQKFDSLSLCYQTSQFWVSGWLTVSITFMTLFSASLIPIYLIKPSDYGYMAVKQERQILAQMFSLSAIGLLIMGALGIGLPALQYMNKIASELHVYVK